MPVAQTRLESLQICKLLQCVRSKDYLQIEKLTLNGVPQVIITELYLINYNDPTCGETPLSTAALVNDESMISFLIDLGAHPDVRDLKGRTSVMRAAELGHVQCVESLTAASCNMSLTDLQGKGVLFYCVNPTQRHERCMQIVIDNGADVNNIAMDTTPVFVAACDIGSESQAVCLKLLNMGADPNSKIEKSNRSALMAACASGSIEMVREMLNRGASHDLLTLKTRIHVSHEAAASGSLESLMALSAYGACFDQADEHGNTPIHYAAKNGHAMCCKFLSQRGCNPKPKNDEGNTAKVIAKDNGHKEALKECKKAEKSFGKLGKNNDPWALALYDLCAERENQFRELCNKVDVDQKGFVTREDFLEILQTMNAPLPSETDMKTLLMVHDNKVHDGIVEINDFLSGKKYVNKQYVRSAFEPKVKKKKKGGKGKKGKTKIPLPICTLVDGPRAVDGGPPPEYVARHNHYTDLGRFSRDNPPEHPLQDDSGWYLRHPDRTYLRLNDAVKHGDLDSMIEVFRNDSSLVDTRDKYYKTPLMTACTHGNIEVSQFLIDNHADIHALDNFHWTALHFACHAGLLDLIIMLVEKGADIDAVTMNGATPLMRAVESSRPDCVQYMIDAGAKMQTENRKGQTPMDIAVSWADARVFDIVKNKWDTLPQSDKKGDKKGNAKKASGKTTSQKNETPEHDDSGLRKGSILRAASALAGGFEETEDITFTPIKGWTEQATSGRLMEERARKRQRFGWSVDFDDFQMPLLCNIKDRVKAFGGVDSD